MSMRILQAIAFLGIIGTQANAIFCTPCYPTGAMGPYLYWECNAGVWNNQGPIPTLDQCTTHLDGLGCISVAPNPNPFLAPAVVPPGC